MCPWQTPPPNTHAQGVVTLRDRLHDPIWPLVPLTCILEHVSRDLDVVPVDVEIELWLPAGHPEESIWHILKTMPTVEVGNIGRCQAPPPPPHLRRFQMMMRVPVEHTESMACSSDKSSVSDLNSEYLRTSCRLAMCSPVALSEVRGQGGGDRQRATYFFFFFFFRSTVPENKRLSWQKKNNY